MEGQLLQGRGRRRCPECVVVRGGGGLPEVLGDGRVCDPVFRLDEGERVGDGAGGQGLDGYAVEQYRAFTGISAALICLRRLVRADAQNRSAT